MNTQELRRRLLRDPKLRRAVRDDDGCTAAIILGKLASDLVPLAEPSFKADHKALLALPNGEAVLYEAFERDELGAWCSGASTLHIALLRMLGFEATAGYCGWKHRGGEHMVSIARTGWLARPFILCDPYFSVLSCAIDHAMRGAARPGPSRRTDVLLRPDQELDRCSWVKELGRCQLGPDRDAVDCEASWEAFHAWEEEAELRRYYGEDPGEAYGRLIATVRPGNFKGARASALLEATMEDVRARMHELPTGGRS